MFFCLFEMTNWMMILLGIRGTSVVPLLALNWVIDRSVKGAMLQYKKNFQKRHWKNNLLNVNLAGGTERSFPSTPGPRFSSIPSPAYVGAFVGVHSGHWIRVVPPHPPNTPRGVGRLFGYFGRRSGPLICGVESNFWCSDTRWIRHLKIYLLDSPWTAFSGSSPRHERVDMDRK